MSIFSGFLVIKHTIRDYEDINWDITFNSVKRSGKPLLFRLWNVANYALFSGKFLNCGKSAGVKLLTNIMSDSDKYKIHVQRQWQRQERDKDKGKDQDKEKDKDKDKDCFISNSEQRRQF